MSAMTHGCEPVTFLPALPSEGGGRGEGCVHPIAGGGTHPSPTPLPQGEGEDPP